MIYIVFQCERAALLGHYFPYKNSAERCVGPALHLYIKKPLKASIFSYFRYFFITVPLLLHTKFQPNILSGSEETVDHNGFFLLSLFFFFFFFFFLVLIHLVTAAILDS